LSPEEEDLIINIFHKKEPKENLSVVVSYEDIKEKNYSYSAGQYFEIKIEYTDITPKEFKERINDFEKEINTLFSESKDFEKDINQYLGRLKYEQN